MEPTNGTDEQEATWLYEYTVPINPDTVDPSRASDRLMQVLVNQGVTYQGGDPELSITTMGDATMTISINADSDPAQVLAGIQKLPLMPREAQYSQAIDRMKAFVDAVNAGQQPTAKQMAQAIVDLTVIIRGAG